MSNLINEYVKIEKQIISFVKMKLENFWKMIWFTRNLMKKLYSIYAIYFFISFTVASSLMRYLVYFSKLSQSLHNLFKLTKKKRIFKRVFNKALWTYRIYLLLEVFFSCYLEMLLFSVILKSLSFVILLKKYFLKEISC